MSIPGDPSSDHAREGWQRVAQCKSAPPGEGKRLSRMVPAVPKHHGLAHHCSRTSGVGWRTEQGSHQRVCNILQWQGAGAQGDVFRLCSGTPSLQLSPGQGRMRALCSQGLPQPHTCWAEEEQPGRRRRAPLCCSEAVLASCSLQRAPGSFPTGFQRASSAGRGRDRSELHLCTCETQGSQRGHPGAN